MSEEQVTEQDVVPSDAPTVSATNISDAGSITSEELRPKSTETIPATHSYQIKPPLSDRFKAGPVKEIIKTVLTETLTGKSYDVDRVKKYTIEIANEINSKVNELKMQRYKHIVQVTLGEFKGAGVKSGVRCFWDAETDGYTSETFFNESIFCLVVVFAVYLY